MRRIALDEGLDGQHTEQVMGYLGRLYDERKRSHTCRAKGPDEFLEWQGGARPVLRGLIGLDRIAKANRDHRARVMLEPPEEVDGYIRQKGHLLTEPHIDVAFWLLHPEEKGPHPLGVFPHGHSDYGMDSYAGVVEDPERVARNAREERDVAVQAVERGIVAIAPNTRGFRPAVIPDLNQRHGGRDCRSQLMHCLLGGRTPVGERVWDMMNLIDWGSRLDYVDGRRILMMGNSGGGVVTIYTSACDPRVKVAVPSCSFCTYVGAKGNIHHCDCNAVPGILTFGDFYDVAGLIAPRHLCVVNGREDHLFPVGEVDRAVEALVRIYRSAGAPDRFVHRYGDGGHRFYKDLMWPFVDRALAE
jgi:dienelactone hydrolase